MTALAVAGTTALLAGAIASPAAAVAAPARADIDTVDYFADTYPGLGTGSVYETVTFERFEYLLGLDGRFAFLIGGPDDANTLASITAINEVAKTAGVERIYNFNPKLDGVSLDVRTSTDPVVSALWARLVTNQLSKDTQTPFDGTDDPTLFVYDKNHTEGGAEDRIVSAITRTTTTAELADATALATYKAEVTAVLGAGAPLSTNSQFSFFTSAINAKHLADYRGAPAYGGDVLDAGDSDFRLQGVTYPELVNILDSEGDYTILLGGTWCHNTRAVVKDVNRQAVATGVEKIYFFDLRLDGKSSNNLHIRDTASAYAHLYGDLVAKYLPNLRTQYDVNNDAQLSQRVSYKPGGDANAALAKAQKLQVPYLFEYKNGRTAGGQAAPIVQQWIKDNGNGTYKEFMTEWWYVLDLPGRYTNLQDPALLTQHAFADEAVTALGTFFRALPGAIQPPVATAPATPDAPTATVSGSTVTVNWTAPTNGGSAITGYSVALNGGVPVAVPNGSTSYAFAGLAAGSYSATVSATNAVGSSAASPASAAVTVAAVVAPQPVDPATVKGTVAVTGSLTPGGTITVTGSGFAAGANGFSVEIHSTPQKLGTIATSASGAFTYTGVIPASVPAGAHSIVVTINGVEVARSAITVKAAAASSSAGLASTGVEGVAPLGWLAVALLAAGLAVFGFTRVRARRAS